MPTKALRLSFVIILVLALFIPPTSKATVNASSLFVSNNVEVASTNPAAVDSPVAIAAGVSAGNLHTCVLTISGGVKCWGYNAYGQLGDGKTTSSLTPVDVVGLASGVSVITVGGHHTCAITTFGGIKCWGFNGNGRLGDGTTTSHSTPVDVSGLVSGVKAVAAGEYHTCALTTSGGVKCWGLNSWGQLGDGTTTHHSTPVDVVGLTSGVSAISSGTYHTCALTNSGAIKCWGANNYGQLGDGTTADSPTPVDVSGLSSGVRAIAAGDVHTCSLTASGGVKCWGFNLDGRLGDGTTTHHSTPVDVSGLDSGTSTITVGSWHSCALTTSGAIKCWGGNYFGQLGDGTAADSSIPVNVSGLASGVRAVVAGNCHTCALTSSGGVRCWGSNNEGQLGDGTTTNQFTPVDVVGFGGAAPKSWLLMYFLAGDQSGEGDLSSHVEAYANALKNINNPNIQIVIFEDRSNSAASYIGINSDGITTIAKEELNTGDPQTLIDFINWAKGNYPAEKTALTIFDHGNALAGVAFDATSSGDHLTPPELKQALSLTGKVDVLHMFTCLMANLEAQYQLRGLTDYYIGSQNIGWAGEIFPMYLPDITSSTTSEQLALQIGQSYYRIISSSHLPSNVSVVDMSKITNLAVKTSALADVIRQNWLTTSIYVWGITDSNVLQRFDDSGNYVIDNKDVLADLYDFAWLLSYKPEFTAAANEVLTAIDEYVIYNQALSGSFKINENSYSYYLNDSHGVSIGLPRSMISYYNPSWLDFAEGANWVISPLSPKVNNELATGLSWGVFISDLVKEHNPDAPDIPSPPALVSPLSFEQHQIYLPAIIR